MLVYANAFQLVGGSAFDVVIRSIHGWLNNHVEGQCSISDICRPGTWNADREGRPVWLRSYVATGANPEMYAWRLKHSDSSVSGRQWSVEIGVRRDDGLVDFSCLIQVEDLSVLIAEPVSASRPRLISYLLQNMREAPDVRLAQGTPGVRLKEVGDTTDSYRALLADIQRRDRDYPIVLISPSRDGSFLINPSLLQDWLLGLAQVVTVKPGFNSWDMESVLGRRYSSWDGAINFIRMPRRDGYAQSVLSLSEEVAGWGVGVAERTSAVLAQVTHNTNIPKQRKCIRPEAVAGLALRRKMDQQRQLLLSQSGGSDKGMVELLEEGLEELTEENRLLQEELDAYRLVNATLKEERDQVRAELATERYKYLSMMRSGRISGVSSVDVSDFLDIASRADQPSPLECLGIISRAFPDRVYVLDSAYESARDWELFESGRRLLGLLKRLCTDYFDGMISGGDDAARRCFSPSEYASSESESTQKNRVAREKRTFVYNGRSIEMWRHLKIGVADDMRLSIRVYFEWIPEERKIVIGHCGEHLPIATY